MTTPIEALRMPLSDGYIAEFRPNGSVAILHESGGLHMAQGAEISMAYEILRLRAALAEHGAQQQVPILGKRYLAGDWSMRNYEAWLNDQQGTLE